MTTTQAANAQTEGVFSRVLVPIEFETARDGEVPPERAVHVGDGDPVVVGPCTVEAIVLAAHLSRGGTLWLVHATPDFREHVGWTSAATLDELDRGARQQAEAVLQAIARRHCPDANIHTVIERGRALEVILAAADRCMPDAMVLAASGRSRVQRAFLGSTADKLIREARWPVIIVPAAMGHHSA